MPKSTPARTRFVEQRLGLVVDGLVGEPDRDARLAADRDRLAIGVGLARPVVAHVGGVDATVLAGDPGEGDQLIGLAVRRGLVVEAGVETDRAGLHPLAGEALHPGDVVRSGPARIPAEDREADRLVRRHRDDVDRRDAGEALEVGLDRRPLGTEVRLPVGEGRRAPQVGALVGRQAEPSRSRPGR